MRTPARVWLRRGGFYQPRALQNQSKIETSSQFGNLFPLAPAQCVPNAATRWTPQVGKPPRGTRSLGGSPRSQQTPCLRGRSGFFATLGPVHAAAPEDIAPYMYPRASECPLGVTQTSGLLYRRLPVCVPSDEAPRRKKNRSAHANARHAGRRPAIQQTGGLRYAQGPLAARPFRERSNDGCGTPRLARPRLSDLKLDFRARFP